MKILGSGVPLASRSLYSYKAVPSSLSAQWGPGAGRLKPHGGVGGKHGGDAKLRAASLDGEEIFQPEAARAVERMPPRGELPAEQSHGSPRPRIFIKTFPGCNRELKNEVLRVTRQPSHNQVYKEQELMFLLCLCFLGRVC